MKGYQPCWNDGSRQSVKRILFTEVEGQNLGDFSMKSVPRPGVTLVHKGRRPSRANSYLH